MRLRHLIYNDAFKVNLQNISGIWTGHLYVEVVRWFFSMPLLIIYHLMIQKLFENCSLVSKIINSKSFNCFAFNLIVCLFLLHISQTKTCLWKIWQKSFKIVHQRKSLALRKEMELLKSKLSNKKRSESCLNLQINIS